MLWRIVLTDCVFLSVCVCVQSLEKPRRVIILVKAGKPVDQTIDALLEHMEAGDVIIDGGNEWFENTVGRAERVAAQGIRYMGMGVSGGEEGARNGPSLMPGGDKEAFDLVEPVLKKVNASSVLSLVRFECL